MFCWLSLPISGSDGQTKPHEALKPPPGQNLYSFEYGFLLQISEEAALAVALNDYLTSRSYLAGFSPTQVDQKAFKLLHRPPDPQHVHALRWYRHLAALQQDLNLESSSE
uniref:Uncharacterized protein n=1 Tax=Amphilophus citrinellus TaxID=61819 RepID=A0A3Q0QUK9_AMPCI